MLQIDGRGFIKGTNQLYKENVIVLQRFSYKGKPAMPGDVIELVGGELIDLKQRGMVRSLTAKEELQTEEKKSKRSKKKK